MNLLLRFKVCKIYFKIFCIFVKFNVKYLYMKNIIYAFGGNKMPLLNPNDSQSVKD